MFEKLLSFWEGQFSGAKMLVLGSVVDVRDETTTGKMHIRRSYMLVHLVPGLVQRFGKDDNFW